MWWRLPVPIAGAEAAHLSRRVEAGVHLGRAGRGALDVPFAVGGAVRGRVHLVPPPVATETLVARARHRA